MVETAAKRGVAQPPSLSTSKGSPKLTPKLSPKLAAKLPKPATPASGGVSPTATAPLPAGSTSTDVGSGQTSQLSPKTGQSSPKTGQKELGVPTVVAIVSPEAPKLHLLSVLGVLIHHMKYTQQETRMESLRWLLWLHQQLPKRVSRTGV